MDSALAKSTAPYQAGPFAAQTGCAGAGCWTRKAAKVNRNRIVVLLFGFVICAVRSNTKLLKANKPVVGKGAKVQEVHSVIPNN